MTSARECSFLKDDNKQLSLLDEAVLVLLLMGCVSRFDGVKNECSQWVG